MSTAIYKKALKEMELQQAIDRLCVVNWKTSIIVISVNRPDTFKIVGLRREDGTPIDITHAVAVVAQERNNRVLTYRDGCLVIDRPIGDGSSSSIRVVLERLVLPKLYGGNSFSLSLFGVASHTDEV
jgi:hypothetical protein